MIELERTYLAKEIPFDLQSFPYTDLTDIYLPSSSNHPQLRVRKCGDKYEITKKSPVNESDSSAMLEETIRLTKEEYNELASLPGKRIKKHRYLYTYKGTLYEFDIFQEKLTGLVLIDVEFTNIQTKDSFTPPPFCLRDVTQESFIAGGMLCGKSYEEIVSHLERHGYSKLSVVKKQT